MATHTTHAHSPGHFLIVDSSRVLYHVLHAPRTYSGHTNWLRVTIRTAGIPDEFHRRNSGRVGWSDRNRASSKSLCVRLGEARRINRRPDKKLTVFAYYECHGHVFRIVENARVVFHRWTIATAARRFGPRHSRVTMQLQKMYCEKRKRDITPRKRRQLASFCPAHLVSSIVFLVLCASFFSFSTNLFSCYNSHKTRIWRSCTVDDTEDLSLLSLSLSSNVFVLNLIYLRVFLAWIVWSFASLLYVTFVFVKMLLLLLTEYCA